MLVWHSDRFEEEAVNGDNWEMVFWLFAWEKDIQMAYIDCFLFIGKVKV